MTFPRRVSGRWGRGRWGFCAGLASAGIAVHADGVQAPLLPSNHALIITVSEYQRSPLPGVLTDRKLATDLATRFGVPPQNIVQLSEQQVTREGLKQAFTSLNETIMPGDIDRLHVRNAMLHADGIEQLCQRNDDVIELDLVIADADVVIRIAVDHEDLGIAGVSANFLALARRAERGPQARKAGAENENARHYSLHLLSS